MNKWIIEDWEFELTAIEGEAKHCRLGLEKAISLFFNTKLLQIFVLGQ